jgi:hypothetical protein
MPRYLVELKGEATDLEEFPRWYPDGPVFVSVEEQRYFLNADMFATSASPRQVLEAAEDLLDDLYAVGLLLWPSLRRPEVEAVIEEQDDGQRRRFLFAAVEETLRLKDWVEVAVNGVPQQPERPTVAQRLLAVSRVSGPLRTAMLIWGEPHRTWPRLYRIVEEVEAALSSSASKAGLCSDNERDRFCQSANSATVAGNDSRHAAGRVVPPKRPMSLQEATSFVGDLLHKSLLVAAAEP